LVGSSLAVFVSALQLTVATILVVGLPRLYGQISCKLQHLLSHTWHVILALLERNRWQPAP
jgi:hypothetical protein